MYIIIITIDNSKIYYVGKETHKKNISSMKADQRLKVTKIKCLLYNNLYKINYHIFKLYQYIINNSLLYDLSFN